MTRPAKLGCAVLVGLMLAIHHGAMASGVNAPGPLAAVVHMTSKIDGVSSADLRKMLSGDLRNWPDRSAVVLIEQPGENETQQRMLQLLLKTTPASYKRALLQMEFQGRELPTIKILNSDETAIKFVWNVPGSVTIADAAAAAAASGRVKILRIDGRLPGERGYLLQ